MNDNTTNVLVVGVGGQGVILASDIMSEVFHASGPMMSRKARFTELAMREGIVKLPFSDLEGRFYSPLIKEGEADILFAFEQLGGSAMG